MTSKPLTTAQVADRLGVSIPTVTKWCRDGLFPNAWRPSLRSTWLIPETDLDTFTPPKMGRPTTPGRNPTGDDHVSQTTADSE